MQLPILAVLPDDFLKALRCSIPLRAGGGDRAHDRAAMNSCLHTRSRGTAPRAIGAWMEGIQTDRVKKLEDRAFLKREPRGPARWQGRPASIESRTAWRRSR